jgi:hypothetical protein
MLCLKVVFNPQVGGWVTFFAGAGFAAWLKKRKGPFLANFFSTVRKSDWRNFSICLARKSLCHVINDDAAHAYNF